MRYEVSPWKGEPFVVTYNIRAVCNNSVREDWYVLPATWKHGDPLPEERMVASVISVIDMCVYGPHYREPRRHIEHEYMFKLVSYVGDLAFPTNVTSDGWRIKNSFKNGFSNYLAYLMIGRNPDLPTYGCEYFN